MGIAVDSKSNHFLFTIFSIDYTFEFVLTFIKVNKISELHDHFHNLLKLIEQETKLQVLYITIDQDSKLKNALNIYCKNKRYWLGEIRVLFDYMHMYDKIALKILKNDQMMNTLKYHVSSEVRNINSYNNSSSDKHQLDLKIFNANDFLTINKKEMILLKKYFQIASSKIELEIISQEEISLLEYSTLTPNGMVSNIHHINDAIMMDYGIVAKSISTLSIENIFKRHDHCSYAKILNTCEQIFKSKVEGLEMFYDSLN